MTMHVVAFSMNNVSVNVGTLVTPVIDPTVTISGNNLQVPDKYNNIVAVGPFCTAGTAATKAQLQSPSLRESFYPSLTPLKASATLDIASRLYELWGNPLPLVTNEGLNYQDNATDSTSAGQRGAVVILSDGPQVPIQKSKIFTMRATATIQQAVNTWVNGAITFDQTLPVGNYDIVGMRAEAAGLLAARLVFIGASAITRPGCFGNADDTTSDIVNFRFGNIGVFGTFSSITPPSVDLLGGTAASQTFYLDLVPR